MTPFYNYLPSLDLHGYDSDYARIVINEFINDNYKMKKEQVIIIHGNGKNVLKKVCQDTLKKNEHVFDFKIDNFNSGMTIVTLKKFVDKS